MNRSHLRELNRRVDRLDAMPCLTCGKQRADRARVERSRIRELTGAEAVQLGNLMLATGTPCTGCGRLSFDLSKAPEADLRAALAILKPANQTE
jgi:hypothetical protein